MQVIQDRGIMQEKILPEVVLKCIRGIQMLREKHKQNTHYHSNKTQNIDHCLQTSLISAFCN